MSLRLALALKLTLLAAPLVVGLAWLRADFVLRTHEAALSEFALQQVESFGRERLDEHPERFPPLPPPRGPLARHLDPGSPRPARRGPGADPDAQGGDPTSRAAQTFAYTADFRSANPFSPTFPEALAERMRAGAAIASREHSPVPGRFVLDVALRAPWDDGSVRYLLVVRPFPTAVSDVRAYLLPSLPVALGMVVVALLAAGPIVARVRRLTASVQAAAAVRYAEPIAVEGRDELSQLAAAFNAAGAEIRAYVGDLEQREASLREFVENTSHDVGLPLSVLQGHLDALHRGAREGAHTDPAVARAALEEVHYLSSLLANLAVTARLDGHAEPLAHHPVDLARVVERVTARERVVARAAGVRIEEAVPEDPLVVLGDETLLEQALSNLVHNAVAHIGDGSNVAVVLSRAEGGRFTLEVLDDGPGVPSDELERLSQRGWRGTAARERTVHGHGLGLAIAVDVAQRHGFTLELAHGTPRGLVARLRGAQAPDESERGDCEA